MRKPTEKEQKIIAGFSDLLLTGSEHEVLRKAFTGIYLSYSRHLLKDGAAQQDSTVDNHLYYLSCLIEVFETEIITA